MNSVPQVPADILRNVRQRWPDVAMAWATNIDSELRALCERFQATPYAVLHARYGFVVAVDSPDGPLVFRGTPDPQGTEQAAVAAAMAKLGISPTMLYTWTTNHGTWTVLDQVRPGTTLGNSDPDRVNIDALFSPFSAMKNRPAPLAAMPSVAEWLRIRLDDDRLADLRPGTTVASAQDRRAAKDRLGELMRDHTPRLCHGDASLSNILACGANEWRLIDPRGVSGESAYDVAVLAIRIVRVLKSSKLLPYIAQVASVDIDRVREWMIIADAARV